jgi:predicted metal-dependent phosphoesterase TrpH
MFIDLHTHTTCSDGTLTPEALVRYAHEKALKAVAITDHDTVAGNKRALREGTSLPLEVIPGVEFSTQCKKGQIHILGLFVNSDQPKILKSCEFLQKKRKERNLKMLENLDTMDMPIEKGVFETESYLGRPHIAQALMESGYVKNIDEAFEKYLKKGKPAYINREKLSEEETIATIVKAEGIPVLAHPVTVYNVEETVERLTHRGLQGIEVYYPTHSRAEFNYYVYLAKKYNLLITGGSDFHGERKPDIDLGCLPVPARLLTPLYQYISIRNRK